MSEPRRLTAVEAAALLRPVDTLALPLGPGQPPALLHAVGEREDFEDLEVSTALLLGMYSLFTRPGVRMRSGFFGPVERGLLAAGHDVSFVPADFRRFAVVLEMMRPRVMATAVAPPDAEGQLSLSLHAGASVEALRACGRDPDRILIAEINPLLPRTLGLPPNHTHALGIDEVDVIVEAESPLPILPEVAPGDVERAIASHVTSFVPDGATLQTGIGAVPSLVVGLLAEGSGSDYGIHSEMFTTGLMQLHRAGKVSNKKGVYDGVSICTFAAGSAELYSWLDGQEAVRFLPVDLVNDPARIAANRRMISINGALSVDLSGQVAADTIGPRQYSGIGGHEDFVQGPGASLASRSLVCLPSTATVAGEVVSRIVPELPAGTSVTTPRHQLDVVITEHGVAELQGRNVQERARSLIEIAHPDLRDEIRRASGL